MTDFALNDTNASPRTNGWHAFLVFVSLATIVPFIAVPLAAHGLTGGTSTFEIYAVLGFLSANFHVATTGWFYIDPKMRSYFRSHPRRYVIVPCLLITGGALAFCLLGREIARYLVIGFLIWQLWHYQKQNVGLLSFIGAGTDKVPLSAWERRTLMLAAVAGILGFFSVSQTPPAYLSTFFAWLYDAGLAVYLLVPVAFGISIIKNPALRKNRLRLSFLLLGSLFFLPTFIFPDPSSALVGYAMAHGLQYVVFMGFVSSKNYNIASFIKLLVIGIVGGVVLNWSSTAQYWSDSHLGMLVYGAFLGVVTSHFVLDAGIWRLRDPFQRGYMREKFSFVFQP